jgi:hypothetical protein
MKAINKKKALWLLRNKYYGGYLPEQLTTREARMRNHCVNIIKGMDEKIVIPYDWLAKKITDKIEFTQMLMSNGGSEVLNIKEDDIDYPKAQAFVDAAKCVLDIIKEYAEGDDYDV